MVNKPQPVPVDKISKELAAVNRLIIVLQGGKLTLRVIQPPTVREIKVLQQALVLLELKVDQAQVLQARVLARNRDSRSIK